jgi:hypothetical protein
MEMIIKPLGAGQDPLNQRQTKLYGLYKFSLIDMEAIDGDMAQAKAA